MVIIRLAAFTPGTQHREKLHAQIQRCSDVLRTGRLLLLLHSVALDRVLRCPQSPHSAARRTDNICNRRLGVRGTEITSIGPLHFAEYGYLLELQLDNNLLTIIENGTFVYLSQLVNLSILSNRLANTTRRVSRPHQSSFPTTHQEPFSALSDIIPALVSLISLRFLLLSENILSQVDDADFASMRNSSLKTLELINCIISGMLALKASCLSRI